MTDTTATVRMYHVGFGDAFLITLRRDDQQWRALIDCGVHNSGIARPLDDIVTAIISHLRADSDPPHLDLVIATHRHADHIAGFANEAWDEVTISEVWLPWIEDPKDPDAVELRTELDTVVQHLTTLAGLRLDAHPSQNSVWNTVQSLAMNTSVNERAMQRLTGQTNGFVEPDNVRYLSNDDENVTAEATPFGDDTTVHVVGPSRDLKVLKRMNPPKSVEWLMGLDALLPTNESTEPLFDPRFLLTDRVVATDPRFSEHLRPRGTRLINRLKAISGEAALLAATRAERWCNNTSVFIVVEIGDRRLVFPGDAQQGGWTHVLDRPKTLKLVTEPAFYKVSHHGSHNGTPRQFVDDVLGDGQHLMLPFSRVKQWKRIPKQELIDALDERGHHIVRADAPTAVTPNVTVADDESWSEITI